MNGCQPAVRRSGFEVIERTVVEVRAGRLSLEDGDDRMLVGRAADGDVRAFEVLMRRYGPMMRVYARRILGPNGDIDDAVQEGFITAWRQLHTLDDTVALPKWLSTIVTRRSIDQLRRKRDHFELDGEEIAAPEEGEPGRVAEAGSRQAAFSAALSTLPDDQRRCWVMREIAHYSYDEIADQLDIPVSTVRGTLARARKNLMVKMEAWR